MTLLLKYVFSHQIIETHAWSPKHFKMTNQKKTFRKLVVFLMSNSRCSYKVHNEDLLGVKNFVSYLGTYVASNGVWGAIYTKIEYDNYFLSIYHKNAIIRDLVNGTLQFIVSL